MNEVSTKITLMVVVVVSASAVSAAYGEINLQWRTSAPVVRVGEAIELGLYAVSDDGSDQAFAALDVIMGWDPEVLELTGKGEDGPYDWLSSSFPNDSGLDRLNADCGEDVYCDPYSHIPFNDGAAMYECVAPWGLDPPPYATLDGLAVTSFKFTALAVTPATRVRFLPEVGSASSTVVIDADDYSDVTGSLAMLVLSVVACGSNGDFDGDCVVGLPDVGLLSPCLAGPGMAPLPEECLAADLDNDGDADLRDFARVQLIFDVP